MFQDNCAMFHFPLHGSDRLRTVSKEHVPGPERDQGGMVWSVLREGCMQRSFYVGCSGLVSGRVNEGTNAADKGHLDANLRNSCRGDVQDLLIQWGSMWNNGQGRGEAVGGWQRVGGGKLCSPHLRYSGNHPPCLFLVRIPFHSPAECAEPQISEGSQWLLYQLGDHGQHGT